MPRLLDLQQSLQEIEKQISSHKSKYTPELTRLRKKRKSIKAMIGALLRKK